MERRKLLAVIAAVAVGSTAVGWVAGQSIRSPAEIAADAAPPAPSLITVPVESRVLSSSVIVRGTVSFSDQTAISVTGDGASVVTRVPKAVGEILDEGDVIVEVSGRPVIALTGELPVFRNLTPGLEGPDVLQLEQALERLGLNPGPVDQRYDKATEAAVAELYRQRGYQPVEPGIDQLATLTAARNRVRGAQESLRIAEQAVANAGVSESTRLQLNQAVDNAEATLAITTNQVQMAMDAAAQEVAAAEAAYAAEPSDANLLQLEAARAQQNLVNAEQTQIYNNAVADVNIARAMRREGLANTNAEGAARQRSDAQTELSAAREDLARLEADIGISFPASELVFLPALPRQIQTVNVTPGQSLSGPVMTVTGTGTLIESAVSANDRALLKVGDTAIIDDEALGISAEATITFLADNPGGGNLSADRYALRLEPNEELPEEAYNISLRVTIAIESTGGEVLAVPLAAVSAGPDGRPRVEIERADGETEMISVTTGLRAQGYLEITPVGAVIRAGDRAVVGRDLRLPGSTDTTADGSSPSPNGDTESEG